MSSFLLATVPLNHHHHHCQSSSWPAFPVFSQDTGFCLKAPKQNSFCSTALIFDYASFYSLSFTLANLEEKWSSFLKHAPHALPSLFLKQPLSSFSSLKGPQDLRGLVLSASLCLVLFRPASLVISPCALPLAFFALICLHNRTSSDWMQALSHKEILPDSQFGHTPLKHAFMQLRPFIYAIYDINVQLPTRL